MIVLAGRLKWVEGAFEPALFILFLIVVLGIAYAVWEFWLSGK